MSEPLRDRAWISDLFWLAVLLFLLIGSGIGWRDPWPADEPRFVALARDMVWTHDWLFPRVGGDLYQDKPPLYFWLLAACYWLLSSVRWSFLLPSFFAACGIAGLVYDLTRRLAGRQTALATAALLVCTVQFVLVTRGAQIDATLCFLTTLSLYGLLRHLLLGPSWAWYALAGLAAGLGVITKGVGFLPLLILIPYCVMRARGFAHLPRFVGGFRWAYAAVGFLIGVGVWLYPMLTAVSKSGRADLIAYRDEILFNETVNRYAASWHHLKPWYFYIVEAIPLLWLPLSLLLIWLVPRWRDAWRQRDARVWLPLMWVLMVVVFFSLSPGKRGIYLFPALPATALAAAPYLLEIFKRRGVVRASVMLSVVLIAAGVVLVVGVLMDLPVLLRMSESAGFEVGPPAAIFLAIALMAWLAAALWSPIASWPAVFASLALVFSMAVAPRLDPQRSGRDFMRAVLANVPAGTMLGLVNYKEQFLLHLKQPVVNFGHRRWREGPYENYDASRWLNEAPNRVILLPTAALAPCFDKSPSRIVGIASGEPWSLVSAPAARECAAQGNPDKVIRYDPRIVRPR